MKTDISYINMDQASEILDCGKPQAPIEKDHRYNAKLRDDYLRVIEVLGYTKINGKGKKKLKVNHAKTSTEQLYKVALNIFDDAGKVTRQYWDSIDDKIMMQDAYGNEMRLKRLNQSDY